MPSVLHQRTEGLMTHLAALNEEFLGLRPDVQRLLDNPPRIDAAESRLRSAEWHLDVLDRRTEGLSAHLAGLSDDHRSLYSEMQSRTTVNRDGSLRCPRCVASG